MVLERAICFGIEVLEIIKYQLIFYEPKSVIYINPKQNMSVWNYLHIFLIWLNC